MKKDISTLKPVLEKGILILIMVLLATYWIMGVFTPLYLPMIALFAIPIVNFILLIIIICKTLGRRGWKDGKDL